MKYGVPKDGVKSEEVSGEEKTADDSDDKDEQDITIAYADPEAVEAAAADDESTEDK